MEFTAKTIAEYLKGAVEGDPETTVTNVSPIENGKKGTLAFLANSKYNKYIYETEASIVLVSKDFEPEKEIKTTIVRVEDAYKAFAHLLDMYQSAIPEKSGISGQASISSTASYGENCYIGNFAFIGESTTIGSNVKIYPQVYIGDNVTIGDNTILYPGTRIYDGCQIGKDCIIHAGAVIGSDGFGFAPTEEGFKKIPQIGIVILEDDVELGANVTIDRATMGATIIHKGAKIDNLVQIAHNVEIGQYTVMAAQVGVSGSTKIGSKCMFGGQVGIAGHITVANEVKVAAQSGIANSIKKDGIALFGSPAFDFRSASRATAVFKNLPELVQRLNQLEREVKDLKNQE